MPAAGYNPTADSPLAVPYAPTDAPSTPEAKPSPFQGQSGFQFNGGGISHGGAIAGIFDNVLRGAVNGLAASQAQKAMKLKRKSDDLNNSYNADAKRLYDMHQAGVDSKSPEYQSALSAVNGSWGALQDFRGQLLEQQGGGKKKTGGKKGEQAPNPLQTLTDPTADAHAKASAMYSMSGRLGAPVLSQIAALNTPQAQQARRTQGVVAQTTEVGAGNDLAKEQAQATYDKYAGKSDAEMAALPSSEQAAFRNAKAILVPQAKPSSTAKEYTSPDGKTQNWFTPGSEPEGWSAYNKPSASTVPKIGTFGDFMAAAYGPHPTAKQYVEGKKLFSPAQTTVGTHVIQVPQPDGSIKAYTVETTSTRGPSGGGGALPRIRQDGDISTSTVSASPSSTAASPTNSDGTQPTRRRKERATSSNSSSTPAPHAPSSDKGVVHSGQIIGGRQTPEETKAVEQADALDTAARDAMARFKTPTPIGDQAIVMNWVRAQIQGGGRMTQTEINNAMAAGSIDVRFKNAYERATTGKLDAGFRRQMVDDIILAARTARQQANSYRQKAAPAAPSGASDEVYAADGKTLLGHVVNGNFVALGK